MLGGNLNQVMDPGKDRSHSSELPRGSSSFSMIARLFELAAQYDLKDVWRLRNDTRVDYTYYSPRHDVFSRIDYFLVDTASTDLVLSCDIGPML